MVFGVGLSVIKVSWVLELLMMDENSHLGTSKYPLIMLEQQIKLVSTSSELKILKLHGFSIRLKSLSG